MDKFEKCITNANDIYVYFEIANMVEPERILDVGMFLKRMGAISRQAMLRTIDDDIYMCGIDCMEECQVGVYDNVYNRIEKMSDVCSDSVDCKLGKYDLAYMMRLEESLAGKLWTMVSKCSKYAVAEKKGFEKNREFMGDCIYKDMKLDDDEYVIVIFG
ncbi:MAG: hypothetical protein IJB96_11615 [Lachnospira sp.]|nr:hypothetical protein [Lachnospira sp.]